MLPNVFERAYALELRGWFKGLPQEIHSRHQMRNPPFLILKEVPRLPARNIKYSGSWSLNIRVEYFLKELDKAAPNLKSNYAPVYSRTWAPGFC